MELITNAIKGTLDLLPSESYKTRYVEKIIAETASLFGFREIRTPVFEHTELFKRLVGDTTDVVQKEMYTFDDKGGRSISLRPEGTAGVMRASLEHGLFNDPLPIKAFYTAAFYRYEQPQAGRLREFHQFGVECIGASAPASDAEIILLADAVFKRLGVKNISLEINSIGCPECRSEYTKALKAYFSQYKDKLCETCLTRLDKNPMRIVDCKSPVCSEISKNAPIITDFLCGECKTHFETVKNCLSAAGLAFTVNPKIVRGLDYYSRTVFEFISSEIGSQGTVCGGGRYDGLSEQLGGPHLPSLGFGMGIERLLMVMNNQNCDFPTEKSLDIYIAPMGERAAVEAVKLCSTLREEGFSALTDLNGRGLKAQMKFANKQNAAYCLVLGDNELDTHKAMLKDMTNGEQTEIEIPGGLVSAIYDRNIQDAFENLNDSLENMNFGKKD